MKSDLDPKYVPPENTVLKSLAQRLKEHHITKLIVDKINNATDEELEEMLIELDKIESEK